MTGTTTRSERRCGNASKSSDEMPIIGMRSAWASALPVESPTRIPVNSPGPTSTATTPSSSRPMSAWAQMKSIAGVTISAWRRPRPTSNSAMTPSWPPSDTLTCSVAVSMPRISMTSPLRQDATGGDGRQAPCAGGPRPGQSWQAPLVGRLLERGPATRPRGAGGRDGDVAGVEMTVDGIQAHDEVLAERRGHDVAPLHEDDAVELGELAERQIRDLRQLVEAVDVGVVERRATGVVAVHEGERGRGDRFDDAERPAEPLGEGRLAGPHLAGEQDDVPGTAQPGQPGGHGVRRVERRDPQRQTWGRRHDRPMLLARRHPAVPRAPRRGGAHARLARTAGRASTMSPATRPCAGRRPAAAACSQAAEAAARRGSIPVASSAPRMPDRTSPVPAVARRSSPLATTSTSP